MKDYSKIDIPEVLECIFHPRKEEKSPLPSNAQDIDIPLFDGEKLGCRFYIDSKQSPTLLYFHGNGETVNDHNEIAYLYNSFGMNLCVITYRGYGWSTGTPTVASLMKDAQTAFTFVQDWRKTGEFTGALFVMGRSLGSAAAIEVAFNNGKELSGLIIESGFADSEPLAVKLGITIDPEFTENDGFNNKNKIAKVTIPTLILHGQKDSLIDISEAEKLQSFSGARNKQFMIIPGADHNTMISTVGDLYFQEIKKYIDTVTGASSWRRKGKI